MLCKHTLLQKDINEIFISNLRFGKIVTQITRFKYDKSEGARFGLNKKI